MSKGERALELRKWLIVFVIVWVSCGVLFAAAHIITDLLEGARPFQSTVITEFFACEGPDSITGLPQMPVSVFSRVDSVHVCGYLQANGSVRLQFVLIYEGKPEGWYIFKEYQTGYIFEEIPESRRRKPGHYRVEVHMGRAKLATTEFTIVP